MIRSSFPAFVVAAVMSAVPAVAQTAVDHLGIPGPIPLGGTSYELAWSSRPDPSYIKQEYLPEGASPESYESMVLVEFLATDKPLSDVVAAQVATVQQRKPADPVANVAIMQNADKSEFLLDFLMSTKDEKGEFIVEWNGYRYVAGAHDGQPGALLFAVSERAYGNDASTAFLRSLKDFKAGRIKALTAADLPRPR